MLSISAKNTVTTNNTKSDIKQHKVRHKGDICTTLTSDSDAETPGRRVVAATPRRLARAEIFMMMMDNKRERESRLR
jgi:hypothetical protein